MEFSPWILLIYILFSFVSFFVACYMVYYFSKIHRMFFKPKNEGNFLNWFLIIAIAIYSLMVISVMCAQFIDNAQAVKNNLYALYLSWILFFISIIQLVLKILLNKKAKNAKFKLINFFEIDFEKLKNDLDQNLINKKLIKLEAKKNKYFKKMQILKKVIDDKLKKINKDNLPDILSDIVSFNQDLTLPWPSKNNDIQLFFFFDSCLKVQKFDKKS